MHPSAVAVASLWFLLVNGQEYPQSSPCGCLEVPASGSHQKEKFCRPNLTPLSERTKPRSCICRPGLVRNAWGDCITKKECLHCKCTRDKDFNVCARKCPLLCNETILASCSQKCVLGCDCPPGTVRDPKTKKNWCVKTTKCAPTCPPQSRFEPCVSTCAPKCGKQQPQICVTRCQRGGCVCYQGYAEAEQDGQIICVPHQDCHRYTGMAQPITHVGHGHVGGGIYPAGTVPVPGGVAVRPGGTILPGANTEGASSGSTYGYGAAGGGLATGGSLSPDSAEFEGAEGINPNEIPSYDATGSGRTNVVIRPGVLPSGSSGVGVGTGGVHSPGSVRPGGPGGETDKEGEGSNGTREPTTSSPGTPPGGTMPNNNERNMSSGVSNNTDSRPSTSTTVNGALGGGLVTGGTSLTVPVSPGGTVAVGAVAPALTGAGNNERPRTAGTEASSTSSSGTRGGSASSSTATINPPGGASISTDGRPAHGTSGSAIVGVGLVAAGPLSAAPAGPGENTITGTAATGVTGNGGRESAGVSGRGTPSRPGTMTGSVTPLTTVNTPEVASMNTDGRAVMGTSSFGTVGGGLPAEGPPSTSIARASVTTLSGPAATVVTRVGDKESAAVTSNGETSASSPETAPGSGSPHNTAGHYPNGIARNSEGAPGVSAIGFGAVGSGISTEGTSSRNAARPGGSAAIDGGNSGVNGIDKPDHVGAVANAILSSPNHAEESRPSGVTRNSSVTTSLGTRQSGGVNIVLGAEGTTPSGSTASHGTENESEAGDTRPHGRRVHGLPEKAKPTRVPLRLCAQGRASGANCTH